MPRHGHHLEIDRRDRLPILVGDKCVASESSASPGSASGGEGKSKQGAPRNHDLVYPARFRLGPIQT
jgi:hypothetical protein